MASSIQNRKVTLKFVNFQNDPCMIFRVESNFSLHLTSRQETVKDVIDLVNFKFPALSNKELIFRPSEGGRILKPKDPATLVWSQLVIEKTKPGSSDGCKSSDFGREKRPPVPKKCTAAPPPARAPTTLAPYRHKIQRKPGIMAAPKWPRSPPPSTSTTKRSPPAKISPPAKSSPPVKEPSKTGSEVKKLTCRKTSNTPHKRFDYQLEESPKAKRIKTGPKSSKSVMEQLEESDNDDDSPVKDITPQVNSAPMRSGPPPLKQLKPPDSPIRYFENDPENRSSYFSYMKLTDLKELPSYKDIVAFKLMGIETRQETRSGSQKVTKLSAFKEGKVMSVDAKYKMVTVELNEPFEVPDESIAGPGTCDTMTVDWTSVYFPKLVSRKI